MNRRVAVIGGGISGLAAAYELTRSGQAEITLFEGSSRLGGIVETVREPGFTIECGPDAWVTEKPWARELVIELGLENELLPSNDAQRRTYLLQSQHGRPALVPLPDGMRMMVPARWGPLMESSLFTWQARLAYLREPKRAEELKAASPTADESVASFVRRHFGNEVTDTLARPLLAGIFGGDIARLSARAVMPAFVKMEAEHGSLIVALQSKQERNPSAIFTTLKSGLQTLVDALAAHIGAGASVRLSTSVDSMERDGGRWRLRGDGPDHFEEAFDAVVLATPAHVTRALLASLPGPGPAASRLLPTEASSAIIVALAFAPEQAARMRVPRGFGFLAPPSAAAEHEPQLLACTFMDQKFASRTPVGGVLLRAFFGGSSAPGLLDRADSDLVEITRAQLAHILGPLPPHSTAVVRRWPLSLPEYEVGHLERMAELHELMRGMPGLHVAGNAYQGVGLPDLVRDARATARSLLAAL